MNIFRRWFPRTFNDKLESVLYYIRREYDLRHLDTKALDSARFYLQELNKVDVLSSRQKDDWIESLKEALNVLKKLKYWKSKELDEETKKAVKVMDSYLYRIAKYTSALSHYYVVSNQVIDLLKASATKYFHAGINVTFIEKRITSILAERSRIIEPTDEDIKKMTDEKAKLESMFKASPDPKECLGYLKDMLIVIDKLILTYNKFNISAKHLEDCRKSLVSVRETGFIGFNNSNVRSFIEERVFLSTCLGNLGRASFKDAIDLAKSIDASARRIKSNMDSFNTHFEREIKFASNF